MEPQLRQAFSRPSAIFDRPEKEKPNSAGTASRDELDQMRFRLIVDGFTQVLEGMNVDPSEATIAFDEARSKHQPPVLLRCRKCAAEFATNASAACKPSLCRECRNALIRERGAEHQRRRRTTSEPRKRISSPDRQFVPKVNTGPCPVCGVQPKPGQIYCGKACSNNRFKARVRAEVVG